MPKSAQAFSKADLSGPKFPQKVLTYLCVKNGNTWTGRRLGYTYAVFHSDKELGLLDWDVTREAGGGDLIDLINYKKVQQKKKPANSAPKAMK